MAARFRDHAGNADVVRQELLAEKGIKLSLRTVEREETGAAGATGVRRRAKPLSISS